MSGDEIGFGGFGHPHGGQFGVTPWHLWGSTQVVQMVGTASTPPHQDTQQLVNAQAKLPLSWKFNLLVKCTYVDAGGLPPINSYYVDFLTTWGVGRSNEQVETFGRCMFTPTDLIGSRNYRQADKIQVVPMDATDPTAAPVWFDTLTASSIQIRASLYSTGAQTVGSVLTASISAYVSPITHVRPEWFNGQFGEEMGGR